MTTSFDTRDSEPPNYWQIASGAGDRSYHEEFIDWGIAFVGERYWFPDHGKGMRHVKKGDIVLLRGKREHAEKTGSGEQIVAVGEVVENEGRHNGCGDKEILRDFDGWDLPAYCYVDWCEVFDGEKTSVRTTIAQIHNNHLRQYANTILQDRSNSRGRSPRNIPNEPEAIDFKEIAGELVGRDHIDDLTSELLRICDLANYYYRFEYEHWSEIKEHEIRAFLIIPLLLALGWDERRIKVELSPGRLGEPDGRKSIDLACFSKDYLPGEREANRENCRLLIESKRFDAGIKKGAPEQVKEYAKDLPNCKTVVATNGYCYKVFERSSSKDSFSEGAVAYLNIRSPKRNYPLDPSVGGALEVLKFLLPET